MKKWIVSELDKTKAAEASKKYGLPLFTAMLLTVRGITEPEDIQRFFSDDAELYDPFLIKDMDRAVKRIKQAVTSYEKICVYGDYDCDGITSTAIVYSYLESVCANVMYYIPDRDEEGYGMNINAVDKLKSDGVKLILTVDNGISAIDEISYADSLGIDVVVTDHHKPLDILPKAVAVVNPHRNDDTSPFHDYCGAGIALKLVIALENNQTAALENYSELAALGTVADIVPLVDENRMIVKLGMKNMQNTERVGISAMIETASISKINSGALGYRFAPRINASGRLGSAYDALSLLLTENEDEAYKTAGLLNSLNSERQSIELEIYERIEESLRKSQDIINDRITVISSEGWHPGVIGIVSSKITEKYGKPTLIISETPGICKGSGRSISGFSLVDAIFACSKYLEKFGGHPMAVGFSIKRENINDFRKAINDYAYKLDKMPLASIKLDCNLNCEAIKPDMVYQLRMFEPFGCGNPKPIFGIKNMRLEKITPVGNGNHLKLSVTRGKARLTLMKFSSSREEFTYFEGDILDFAVSLDVSVYMGKEELSFTVKDIKLSDFDNERAMYDIQLYEAYKNGKNIGKLDEGRLPERSEFAALYRYIRKADRGIYSLDSLCTRIFPKSHDVFKLLIILDIMKELYLINYTRECDIINVTLRDVDGKVDINASRILRKLKEDVKNA